MTLPLPAPDRSRDRRSGHGPFDVWAPRPGRVRLVLQPLGGDHEVLEMRRGDDDWWVPEGPLVHAEADYGYLLDHADVPVPDPRSLRQPDGVHGLSRTFDPASFAWTDQGWTGRQLAGSVVYELHVGTFTPEGTLDAACAPERLAHLRSIGVDLVEVMPVNAFNGTWGWGYDGVLWSAVHEPYGGPAAYQRFVDACHGAGLGVVQDVVHNHLGPSGNYLPLFGPYLKEGANTWGDLVNLDREGSHEVRRLVLDSVRTFLEDYHVDALRLDAVHALHDDSPVHLLEEMAVEVAALSAHLRRPLTLVAESDLNDAHVVTPREARGWGIDAQWSDDLHHAVHVAVSGETTGYYADFEPLSALAKVLTKGFFHDGTFSSFRGRDHGAPVDTATMPGWRLVVCSQNHDQVGNRARGDRLTDHLDDDRLACAALLVMTSPFTPMLFQGEEWAASTPFAFFASHPEPELATATAEGRIAEFAAMGWDPDEVLDPLDPATFEASRLDWSELEGGRHARLLAFYRELATLRRTWPDLTDPVLDAVSAAADDEARTIVVRRGRLLVAVNLGTDEALVDVAEVATGDGAALLLAALEGPVVRDAGGWELVLPPGTGAVVGPA